MKVVHLCMQHYGGAGTSAQRLHAGLLAEGVDSTMLVLKRRGDDASIRLLPGPGGQAPAATPGGETIAPGWTAASRRWQELLGPYPNRSADLELFSDPWADTPLDAVAAVGEADVLNLHWVAGMVDFARDVPLLASRPVVWTLHDMNPFTGGCHYSVGCQRWREACGACPLLGSADEADASRRFFETRRAAYAGLDLTVVTPSRWLGDCAGASALLGRFPVRVIPYGLPVDVFRPYSREAVRRELGVPEGARVVLFGAAGVHNRRKGLRFLVRALELLAADGRTPPVVLAMFGEFGGQAPRLPFPVLPAGYVTDETQLALLYSMADVYVLPSLEDNLPNVVLEALACGTPVVGFDTGGIPDMVEHKRTGWLVPPGDAAGLADGIRWALGGPAGPGRARLCRSVALERYPLAAQARAYVNLYAELLARRAGRRG
ncbi:glycosyltransferase family 4 protein [Desulfocurvus vexinensis]|uniref:glycosyltransferase family 4 protein n=1 Tax=Desulfocurvus vexinensis TaxID=399548 RepID=UPI0004B1BDB3|nr:glycosyltransferase family 4 protein [Desulfocurvus vexinensis]